MMAERLDASLSSLMSGRLNAKSVSDAELPVSLLNDCTYSFGWNSFLTICLCCLFVELLVVYSTEFIFSYGIVFVRQSNLTATVNEYLLSTS